MTAEITKQCGTVGNCYEKWQLVFLIVASIHIFDIVFYLIFGSGELQDWAIETIEEEMEGVHVDSMAEQTSVSSSGYGTCITNPRR